MLTLSLLIGCSASEDESLTARPVTAGRIVNADSEPGNWLSHGRTYDEQRFSPLTGINDGNVSDLGLAWHFDIDTARAMEATPLITDGVMYVTAAWSVLYALDAKTGAPLWKYDPQVPKSWGTYACCDVPNRGAALWGDKVYVATLDGYLAAIDTTTGMEVWKVDTIDRKSPYTITGAPRVVKGKVIIGNGGAEYGVRGFVSAFDAETGELVWKTYTVPGNPADEFESDAMRMAAGTWSGEWWKMGGGGTAWDSFAYDAELDLLYVGTGNGSPWNREVRSPDGGDNLFLASILALKPDTGEYVWHYQTTPGDTWDYTATQHMILADIDFGAGVQKVLMQAPKNGFFYVLDRRTGKLLSADAYVPLNWASHVDLETGRPVELEGARYEENYKVIFPSSWGGHNWHPMSFSPLTGLVYVPLMGQPEAFANGRNFAFLENHLNLGTDYAVQAAVTAEEFAEHPDLMVRISAWDPVAGKEVFRIDSGSAWNAGVLSTAGNLVFQGEAGGEFAAYAADTGRKLWSAHANTGIMAPPVTYEVDGEQYVTVVGGWGIHIGVFEGDPASDEDRDAIGRVLTYKLGASGTLPRATAETRVLPELPDIEITAEQVTQGGVLYNARCAWCHGTGASGTGAVPDLRYATKETHAIWTAIVLDGAYVPRGMPVFREVLTEEEALAIQAYVLDVVRNMRQ
ncbi:MAG: PQQ-dependent dehydrogenase, methanol/ethanol family [Gammaproteobacteria bacterium]|nr:PQQ-dependent dehydrogenase, methanol/ethanol family [Gammaproteobacteria bacterium]